MPELPEIQTIVNFLRPKISGRKILGLEVFFKKILREFGPVAKLRTKTVGHKITSVERVGKWVVLNLSSGESLLFHLMMTGKLLLNPKNKNGHDRLVLFLSGNNKLVFNDVRKFGKCQLISPSSIIPTPPSVIASSSFSVIARSNSDEAISRTCPEPAEEDRHAPTRASRLAMTANDNEYTKNNLLSKLGRDPLTIKFKEFKNLIDSKNKNIKNFLLDQKFISGIGNIYADEILWEAEIHPLRRTNALANPEILKLFKSCKKVLRLAIKKGGTSSRDYRKPDNTEGEYYKIRKAYQRTGEKCSRCEGTIQRIIVGGRSAHFCPTHQT